MDADRKERSLWQWLVALVLLVTLGGLLACNYWPAEPGHVVISRETTYIDGPVNPDGTINYVAYLDGRYAEGVTPENNAAPLLLQACGPQMLPEKTRSQTLARLAIPAAYFDNTKPLIPWEKRHPTTQPATRPDANAPGEGEDAENAPPPEPGVQDFGEALLAGKPAHPELEGYLARNAPALELVRKASTRPRFYLPLISTSNPPYMYDVLVANMTSLLLAGDCLAARALLRAARNDPQGAWDDVLALHRLARLVDQLPLTPDQIIAAGMDRTAATVGIHLATRGCLPGGGTQKLLPKLSALRPIGNELEAFDRAERFFSLDQVMSLRRVAGGATTAPGVLPMSLDTSVDWNQLLRRVNALYDQAMAPMRLPRFQGRQAAKEAFDEHTAQIAARRPSKAMLYIMRYGGRFYLEARTMLLAEFLACMMPDTQTVFCQFMDSARMTHEIETLSVAIACFHDENGRWPGKLAELCPSLLKTIPADRFSPGPLHYQATDKGYLLYSVGMNLKDDTAPPAATSPAATAKDKADDIVARSEATTGSAVAK
jgi:hypothetical protein